MDRVIFFALGVVFGSFIIWAFNPADTVVKGKVRAKKGAKVNFNNNFKNKENGFFTKLLRRRRRDLGSGN